MPRAERKYWGKRYGRYVRWEGMTWPMHIEPNPDLDSVGWRLVRGLATQEDLGFAASVLSAYAALIESTEAKRREVVAELRHAAESRYVCQPSSTTKGEKNE